MIEQRDSELAFYDRFSDKEVVNERNILFQRRIFDIFNECKLTHSVNEDLADCMHRTNLLIRQEQSEVFARLSNLQQSAINKIGQNRRIAIIDKSTTEKGRAQTQIELVRAATKALKSEIFDPLAKDSQAKNM